MQRSYRVIVIVLFAMMAFTVMSYLSERFEQGDIEKAVTAVQAHLYGDNGEAAFRERLGQQFGLTDPELRWWGRLVSNFYGVVQVTLVARDGDQKKEFVWEMGLVSGDLVPKNEAAATLMHILAPAPSPS